jgi:N-acetylneuraminate lyase
MPMPRLSGLIVATFTPFSSTGELALERLENYAAHLVRSGVAGVFIGGTTGECLSLSVEERLQLAERWFAVTRGSSLAVVVHVGSLCQGEAVRLAEHAAKHGAVAVSTFAPSYHKPNSVAALIDWCKPIATAAGGLPFYFYDIPSMTGVSLSMPEFLERGQEQLPNLAGLKFTNADLQMLQLCLDPRFAAMNILWGMDELLLPAWACGVRGAVGSTYNFAAGVYHRLLAAVDRGDWITAQAEQRRSIRLVQAMSRRGYMAASRVIMEHLGVPLGSPRAPLPSLAVSEHAGLIAEFEMLMPLHS